MYPFFLLILYLFMEKQVFELLLNDLYDRYNPSNKKEIPNILSKYVAQELDAVYYFLTKYNYPKHPNYDPKLSGLESIKFLIKNYMDGVRSLTINTPGQSKEQVIEKKLEEASNQIKSTTEQVNEQIKSKLENISSDFKNTKEELKNEVAIWFQQFVENAESKNKPESHEVKLNILYTEEDVKLPKEICEFQVGARFLVSDSNGKLVALEVKDVFYDFVSNENGYIKEITIDKI